MCVNGVLYLVLAWMCKYNRNRYQESMSYEQTNESIKGMDINKYNIYIYIYIYIYGWYCTYY